MKVHSEIKIPVALAEAGGVLQDFVWNNVVRGSRIAFGQDEVTIQGLNPNEQPTFAALVAIVQNGGSFSGIRLAIEFTNVAAAQQDVPSEVRGSTTTDEEGNTVARNWVEWFRSSSSSQVITNGTLYVAKTSYNGNLLNSAELSAIHAQAGVRVIEWADAVSRYQDESYTVFEL